MNYYKIQKQNVLSPFATAKELFSKSYQNFDGDVEQFNSNQKNNFIIHPHNLGLYISWKPGVLNKLKKEFQQVFNLPVYNIFVFYTPAHGYYQWHNEGTDNLSLAPIEFQNYVNKLQLRRNVAINYKLVDGDLSTSKLVWGKEDDDVYNILKQHYHNVTIDKNYRIDDDYVMSLGYESILNNDKIKQIDEYKGMDTPTIVRTNIFHKIDNTECDIDRIVGTVSFSPNMYFEDVVEHLK